jgi:hypothetical protein
VPLRRDLLLWTGALVCALALLIAGSGDVAWSDFDAEAWPAYKLLLAGDFHGYLQHMPGYSGFVTLVGAPATALTALIGGGEDAIFRLTAIPGLLALAFLAVTLAREARKPWIVLGLTAASPLALKALQAGHPEDLLATAAAVGAVLAARSNKPTAAGLLLVLAVAAKQWAVLAILPAVLAAPRGGGRVALIAGAGTLLVLGAQTLFHPLARGTLLTTGDQFHPHQIWWPFGVDAPKAFTEAGHGVRTSPLWLRPITHPLIVALAVPLSIAAWMRKGRNPDDALALLALLFLLRCALDPWNLVYYQLPLVVALTAYEVRTHKDWPVLALAATAATWLTFVTYTERTTNGPFLAYMAWTIPLGAYLVHRLYVRTPPLPYRRPWPVDPTSAGRLSSPSTSTT